MTRPQISIVMPVFNCARTLQAAVNSVLAQSFADWELLILDDGSGDATVRIAQSMKDPRLRIVCDGRGNCGLAARLNQGVAMARGDFIARMDGDDLSFPLRFERQLETLVARPDVDLLGCSMILFDSQGNVLRVERTRTTHAEICGSAVRSCLLPHATWMGRSQWFRAHPYDEVLRRAEDRDLLLRSRHTSQFARLDEILYAYRVDRLSLRNKLRARREYFGSLLTDARRHSQPVRGMVGAGAELGKLFLDLVAPHRVNRFWRLRPLSGAGSPSVPSETKEFISRVRREAIGGN